MMTCSTSARARWFTTKRLFRSGGQGYNPANRQLRVFRQLQQTATSPRPAPPFHLATHAQSVYEVETGLTAVPPSVTPETLFLCACRALAYSVSSAAAATSPLGSLRGHAAAAAAAIASGVGGGEGAAGGGGGAIDHGDANRLRCLRLVAEALRKAAGQAGLEETVSEFVGSAACVCSVWVLLRVLLWCFSCGDVALIISYHRCGTVLDASRSAC